MLKRTHGRLLITLLVITGLAGTLNNTSLSQKERKFAINLMKEGKAELFQSAEGLSGAQLNFKSAPGSRSVKHYIYHIASCEQKSWDLLTTIMKTAPNPEKRSLIKFTDDQLVAMMEDPASALLVSESGNTKNESFKSVQEALDFFKTQRMDHIKYMKLSTEDLRNHVVEMPFGWIDCYQFCLMIGSHSKRHIKQIEELKSDPRFPVK
ncbi:MAG: DinB family protein [Chitinophagaceae bacterium]|jgi:hypothetical protein|nr:DinB family protein [Chitinophagaceae bacterium]OQY96083.1 MAG: hypothetical protein B6D37_02955 [Sphingobacteriales bacterium UTBCD1]